MTYTGRFTEEKAALGSRQQSCPEQAESPPSATKEQIWRRTLLEDIKEALNYTSVLEDILIGLAYDIEKEGSYEVPFPILTEGFLTGSLCISETSGIKKKLNALREEVEEEEN